MPLPQLIRLAARGAAFGAMVLSLGAAGCGDRAEGTRADRTPLADAEPSDDGDIDGEPAPPKIDPCRLLADEELSEQLWLTVSPSQREHYNAKGFDVTRTEVPWGISRRCEFTFRSKATVSGGPATRGDFNVMVSHASLGEVADRYKKPIPGVGDEAYRYQQVWYVRVGDLIASLTDFDGTDEPGLEPDAGRIALLEGMAQRLR